MDTPCQWGVAYKNKCMYSATGLESKMSVFLVFLCVLACIL